MWLAANTPPLWLAAAPSQAFRAALASGYDAVEVSRGQVYSMPFRVDAGQTVEWAFRVWDRDISFKVTLRTMAMGGSVEARGLSEQRDGGDDTCGCGA